MNWGWAFLIVLFWIVGTILLYCVIEALDKRFHFQSSEGFAGLGRWLMRILYTIVPPVLFLAVNLLIRIGRAYGWWWIPAVLILEIVFIPLVFFIKELLLNPKRIAEKARREIGDFAEYEREYYREHANHPEFDGGAPYGYLGEQLDYMSGKQGCLAYFFCPKKKRKAFAGAIVENNLDILPTLCSWDYYEEKDSEENVTGNGYDSFLVLIPENGEKIKSRIYRDSLPLFLWLCLKQMPKLLLDSFVDFFRKTGRLLKPKKKQQ